MSLGRGLVPGHMRCQDILGVLALSWLWDSSSGGTCIARRHLHFAVGFAVVSLALVWAPSLLLLECGTGHEELEGGWMMVGRRKVLREKGAGGICLG